MVLMAVVLVDLGEPGRRVAPLQERDVVAAAQEAVAPVDDLDAHARGQVLPDLLHVAGQLARLRVVLAPSVRRSAASSGVSFAGGPSAKSRTAFGSRSPFSPVELPMMSFVNIASTSTPACLACSA